MIPLHPLTVSDILDGAFKLYRGTFRQVVVLVLVVLGPVQLLSSLGSQLLLGGPLLEPAAPSGGGAATGLILVGVTFLATVLLTPLVNGAVTWVAARYDVGEPYDWADGLRAAGRRYGTLLAAAVLTVLIAVGLMIALVVVVGLPAVAAWQVSEVAGVLVGVLLALVVAVPALLALTALFYVVVPAIVLEEVTAVEALRRSYRLLRPRLLRAVGIVLLAALLVGLVQSVLMFGFVVVGLFAGPFAWVFDAVGSTLGQLVGVPLAANIALLLYVDARIRREGLDIELLAARLPGG